MVLHSLLLAADVQDAMPPAEQGFMQTIVMIGVAFIFFYFILFRPEQKKRKAQEEQRNKIKKGDRVTTIAGVLGTVYKINQDTVVISLIEGAKMECLKASIADVHATSEEEAKKED